MEREKEMAKLVNVLRRTARMALQSEWTGSSQDAARFCAEQYNRVLARLRELDPAAAHSRACRTASRDAALLLPATQRTSSDPQLKAKP